MRPPRPLICATSIAAFVLSLGAKAPTVQAADLFWDGSTSNSWSALENWTVDPASPGADPVAIPGANDIAIFNFTGTPANQIATFGSNQSVGGLKFATNSTVPLTIGTVNDFTLTLGTSGLLVETGAAAHTVNSGITLGGAQTWTNNSTSLFTLGGTLTTGANNLTFTGAGAGFALNGPIAVNGASTWTNNGTAALTGSGTVTLTNNLTLSGSGAISLGAITNSGGNRTLTINGAGNRTLGNLAGSNDGTNRTLTINVASGSAVTVGSLNNGGTATGSSFTKSGGGTMTVSGTNNTFNGTLTINDGTVVVSNASASGNPALTLGGVANGTPKLTVNNTYRVGSITQSATGNAGIIDGTGSLWLNGDRTITANDGTGAVDLTINVPIANGDTSARQLTKAGAGTLQINAINTFTGTFVINNGTVIMNAGQSAAGALTLGGTAAVTPVLTINSGVVYRLGGNVTQSATGNGGIINGGGTIGLYGDRAIIINDSPVANDLVVAVPITNGDTTARVFRKEGTGQIQLTADNTYSGATEFFRGTVLADYSSNNGSKFSDTNPLRLRGGTLVLEGNSGAATSETVGGLDLGTSSSSSNGIAGSASVVSLVSNGGQAITLNMGAITRPVGGSVAHLTTSGANATYATTSTNTPLGIVSPGVFFNNRFATVSGGNVDGAGTAKNDRGTWLSTDHVVIDGPLTGQLAPAVASIVFDVPAATALTIDNRGTGLNVRSGGIFVTPKVGANDTTISGGQLTTEFVGATGGTGELVLSNYSSGTLAVHSTLGSNNAPLSTIQQLTLSGTGPIEITGRNLYTGTTNVLGTVRISGGNALSDFTNLQIGSGGSTSAGTGGVLMLNGGSEGVGNLVGGAFSNQGSGDIQLGTGGALTINQTGNTTYSGLISGTGTVIKRAGGTLTLSNGAQPFTGEIQVLGGTVDLTTNTSGLTGVTSVLLRGGSMLSQQDQSGNVDKIGNNATIKLEGTTGNGLRVTSNQNATRTESVQKLEINASASVITLTNTSNTTPSSALTVLAFTNTTDSFSRSNNATLLIRSGVDLGGSSGNPTSRVTFASDMSGDLIGGNGAAGSSNISILPFAVGGSTLTSAGESFLTIGANGVRPLNTTTEYATNYAAAAATANLSVSATTGSLASATFNSLRIDNSAGNVNLTGIGGGSNVLTLTSGGLLVSAGANTNGTTISGFDRIVAGASDAAPDELIVHVNSSNAAPGSALLTIDSAVANNGAAATSLTKSGAGTLVLRGTNTYSGETTINQGTVEFSSASNLGADGLIRLAGGTLTFAAGNTTDISKRADNSLRTVELIGPSAYLSPAGAGNIVNVGNRIDVGTNNVTFANAIGNGGVGGLTKAGTGTLTLNAAPTYKGATLVREGTMNFATIAADTTSALYLAPDTGVVNTTVTNGLDTQSVIVGGSFTNTGSVEGNLTVSGGAVNIGDGSGDDFLLIGWRDASAGTAATNTSTKGLADFQNASSVNIDVSQIVLGFINSGVASTNPTASGSLLLPTSASASNTITANRFVIGNAPAGTFNNTVTSTVHLGGGTTAMNVDSLTVGGQKSAVAMTIGNGGSFTLRGLAGGNSAANVFIGDSDSSNTGTSANAHLDLTGAAAMDMKINSLAIGRVGLSNGSGSGSGTLSFDTGSIEATSIRLADPNFRATTDPNAAATKGTINQNGGTFRFADLSKGTGTGAYNWAAGTIGNLPGSNLNNLNVTVSLETVAAHTFDVSEGHTATFQSAAGFTGVGGFTKAGLGTLNLNGTNSHLGDTVVESGTLNVGGSIMTSTVAVNTGTLGGGGSILGAVNVGNGAGVGDATLSPGLNGIGTLTTGAISLNSDAVFALEINIANGTTVTSDLITSTGPLTLTSPALVVSNLGNNTLLTAGTVIPFLTYTGPWNGGLFSVEGTVISDFNGVANSTFTVGVNTFAIDYDNGGAAALVVVPEPGSAVMALAGIGALLGRRRLRRSR